MKELGNMGGFQMDGKKAIIDVRERVLKGEHPRKEILDYIKAAPVGTVFEIHIPHRGEPLIAGFQAMGMNVIVKEIEPGHFLLTTVKLTEMR
jgi:hypothetical protein